MSSIVIKVTSLDQPLTCSGFNVNRSLDDSNDPHYKLSTRSGEVIGKIDISNDMIYFREFNGPLDIFLDNDRPVTVENSNLLKLEVGMGKVKCKDSSTFNQLKVFNLTNLGKLTAREIHCEDILANFSEIVSDIIQSRFIPNKGNLVVDRIYASKIDNYKELKARSIQSDNIINRKLLIVENVQNAKKFHNVGTAEIANCSTLTLINKFKLTSTSAIDCVDVVNKESGNIVCVDINTNDFSNEKDSSVTSSGNFDCTNTLTNKGTLNSHNIIFAKGINEGTLTSSNILECKNVLTNGSKISGKEIRLNEGANNGEIQASKIQISEKRSGHSGLLFPDPKDFQNKGDIKVEVINGHLLNAKRLFASIVNDLSLINQGDLYIDSSKINRFSYLKNSGDIHFTNKVNGNISDSMFPRGTLVKKIVLHNDAELSSESNLPLSAPGKTITIRHVQPNRLASIIKKISNTQKVVIHTTGDVKLSENFKVDTINFLEIITSNFSNTGTITVHGLCVRSSKDIVPGTLISSTTLELRANKDINMLGKNDNIYGFQSVEIKCDSLTLSALASGIETENGQSYTRKICGTNYIASGGTISITNDSIINYGQIIAKDNITINSRTKVTNEAGLITSNNGNINVTTPNFYHKRNETSININVPGVPDYSILGQHLRHDPYRYPYRRDTIYQYPGSGPALIEAASSIRITGNFINQSSNIICGGQVNVTGGKYTDTPLSLGKYVYRPKLAAWGLQTITSGWNHYDSARIGELLFVQSEIDFYQVYIPDVCQYRSSIRTGNATRINTGQVILTACMSSKLIAIRSTGSATFSNPSVSNPIVPRKPNEIVIINLNRYIKDNIKDNSFYRFDGSFLETVVPMPFPSHIANRNCRSLYLNQIPSHNIINPLERIDIDPWIRRAMAELSGVVLDTMYPSHVLLSNADDWSNRRNRRSITHGEIKQESNQPLMVYDHDGDEIKSLIVIPESVPNVDIFAEERFICETEGNQIYSNVKIAAGNEIRIASNSNVIRETGKYSVTEYHHNDGANIEIYKEITMPQQEFISGGDINVNAMGNYRVKGSSSCAIGNINERARGFITKEALPLISSYKREHYESCGHFSSDKHIIRELSTTQALITNTIAGGNLIESSGSKIELIGVSEIANDIAYDTNQLNIRPLPIIAESYYREDRQSAFSKSRTEQRDTTISFLPSNIRAHNELVFAGEKASLCSSISAETVRDNTRDGVSFDIDVRRNEFYSSQSGKSPLSSYNVGKSGYQEVMEQCRLHITRIIRNIEAGHIKFNSVIWEKRSDIAANYIQTCYSLKSYCHIWNEYSQVVPDAIIAVVALAVSYFTAGVGTFGLPGLAGTLTSSALTNVSIHVATNILRTGDLSLTFSSLFSKEYGKKLLSSTIVKSLCGNTSEYSNLTSMALHYTTKNIVSSCVDHVMFGDQIKPGAIIKNSLINSVGACLSNSIGNIPDPLYRKSLHTILGGALGYVKENDVKGIIPGASGALLSEIVADYVIGDGISLEEETLKEAGEAGIRDERLCQELFREKLKDRIQLSILLTNAIVGLGTSLVGGNSNDVDTSIYTSANCLEHNRMAHVGIPYLEYNDKNSDIEEDAGDEIDQMIKEEVNFEERMTNWNKIMKERYIRYNQTKQDLLFAERITFEEYKRYLDLEFIPDEEIRAYPFQKNRDNYWITVPSTLEHVRGIANQTFSNFSSLANKNISEYRSHDYFALPSLCAAQGIGYLDNLLNNPLERIGKRICSVTKGIGDNIRNITYKCIDNRALSQDIGYTAEFLLNKIVGLGIGTLRIPKLAPTSTITSTPALAPIPKRKRYEKYTTQTVDNYGKGSWNIKDIKYSDYISFYNRGPQNEILAMMKKDKTAPFIVASDGSPRYVWFRKDVPNSNVRYSNKNILHNTYIGEDGQIWVNREILMDHRMLANYIKAYSDFKYDRPVTLFSCTTATGTNNIAQRLADKMGVPVNAPDLNIVSKSTFSGQKMVITRSISLLEEVTGTSVQQNAGKGKFITFNPGEGAKARKNKAKKQKEKEHN